MADPKKSSSFPAKKSKAKADKPAKATYSTLSAEFIVDSDDSGDARTPTVQRPVSKKTKTNPSSAKPAATKASISQAKPSKKRKSPSPSPVEDDSSGSESGNGSISQDGERRSRTRISSAQDGSPTPKPKLATPRPLSINPSNKSSINVKPLGQEEERRTGATKDQSKLETGESSEDGSSGSESGSGSESASGSRDKISLQGPKKKDPVRESVAHQPTPTYKPPAGFEPTSISLHPASTLSDILAPSNLQGKQIWHITAPDSVPISLVKEISTPNIGNGASILEYHGAKYGLVPESGGEQASSRTLLLPSTRTNDYRLAQSNIIKTLHLQQLVSLPNHALKSTSHPNRSASPTEFYTKTPRQQPEGLKMRYRPFGVSDDSDLDSTSEPMPRAPEFRMPAPVGESSHGKKRKRPKSDDDDSSIIPVVKSKKRKEIPQATSGAIENPIDVDAISDKRSTEAKSPTKTPHPKANGVQSDDGPPAGNETKEERRKRREKKRLDKLESQSKPATALPLDLKQDAETMQPGEVVEGVPAFANAVEGTTSTNGISPHKESKEEKAKLKKGNRKRREMERKSRGASLISAEDKSQREAADSQDEMMQEIENAQRAASIQIPTPKGDSPHKHSRHAQQSENSAVSNPVSHRKETKEEKAKRREEKRRRRMERSSA